jgi:hypothetical protein
VFRYRRGRGLRELASAESVRHTVEQERDAPRAARAVTDRRASLVPADDRVFDRGQRHVVEARQESALFARDAAPGDVQLRVAHTPAAATLGQVIFASARRW